MTPLARIVGRPVAVTMFFLAVTAVGAISLLRLPIDLLPDLAYPRLVIYTSYPNVAPAEVERLVTEPIERSIAGVPGLETVESRSREGVSLITLRFAWGTDMDFAALDVREKLDQLAPLLPDRAARPVVFRTDPAAEPIMALSIAGPHDLWALQQLAESVFKRRLEQIDGVAHAAITGGLEREIYVELDQQRLESYALTIDDVETAILSANATAPSGTILRGRYRYSLRTLGELTSVDGIGDVVIERTRSASLDAGRVSVAGMKNKTSGTGSHAGELGEYRPLITLRDVARIEDRFRERESITRYNGQDAIGILLFKEAGNNAVRVAHRVDAVINELRAQHPGVAIEIAMNQAEFVDEAIDNVLDALIQGGILAFLVLFFFLRDPRYPIAISLSIPISVIATFALLDLAGVSLNIMSLGGLALGVGMLVDNSIVVLENISRHRGHGLSGAAAAVTGATEVIGAITGATLTTIAVFGPIVYIRGIAGQLLRALSLAVSFSLLASLITSIILVPTLAARWGEATNLPRSRARGLPRPIGIALRRLIGPLLDSFDRAFASLVDRYERALAAALRRRGSTCAAAALLLASALGIAFTLDRAALPAIEQGTLRLRVELPRGTPIEETARIAAHVDSILRADPSVADVFTRVGRQGGHAGRDLEESGLNTALLEVRLRPRTTSTAVIDRIRAQLASYPPGVVSVVSGHTTTIGRFIDADESGLSIIVHGDDLELALDYARMLSHALARAPELTNVRLGADLGHPEIRVSIDHERAASFGIEPIRIAQTIEKYMLGTRATDLVDFDRKIPIIIGLPAELRRSLESLDILHVDGIPLRELVRIAEAAGPAEIRRVDQARMIPIHVDRQGSDLAQAVAVARDVIRQHPAPAGVRADIRGENDELRRSLQGLAVAFVLALTLVYMILAAEFESLTRPFIVLLSTPLALVGAVFALRITSAGLNAMSLIGMVILVGIAVNNAIVLVDFIDRQRRNGMSAHEAILTAARARLRPIIMTTITTLLGILPMAIGLGRGADLRAPLAIAIFGGLFTSTVLTLFVIPVAYDIVDQAGRWLRSLVRARAGARTGADFSVLTADQAPAAVDHHELPTTR